MCGYFPSDTDIEVDVNVRVLELVCLFFIKYNIIYVPGRQRFSSTKPEYYPDKTYDPKGYHAAIYSVIGRILDNIILSSRQLLIWREKIPSSLS